MLTQYFRSSSRIEELCNGPGGHLLEGFAKELFQARYKWVAARTHIRLAEHFLNWMSGLGLLLTVSEDRFAEEFLTGIVQ
jgi:hypothetical protein